MPPRRHRFEALSVAALAAGILVLAVGCSPRAAEPRTDRAADTIPASADPALGRRLAQTWCSNCHAVEGAGQTSDTAPPFQALLRGRKHNVAALRTWLHDPHPPMQGIELSRAQINDILAYLDSIATE